MRIGGTKELGCVKMSAVATLTCCLARQDVMFVLSKLATIITGAGLNLRPSNKLANR